jgi:hypothetical protein
MGDGLTWGYDITGHKLLCTRCHDTKSKHIDGNRLPVLQYIQHTENPTNFRFRTYDPLVPEDDRPTYDMQLPYTEYVPGPEGSFALCYRCHDEAAITTSAASLGEVHVLNTNFREEGNIFGASERNLHYYHVVLEQWSATCILCHDPHGMPNPAMTRKDMGNLVYVDENNCEITDTEDWSNPDLNIRGIQAGDLDDRFCFTCHMNGVSIVGQCAGGNNQYADCSNSWGCYDRNYKQLPHTGGMEFSIDCAECHGSDQSHITHTQTENNTKGPDALLCEACHVVGDIGIYTINDMVMQGVCDTCHSPNGAFDGINDPIIGAASNWDEGVYESDGKILKAGKEKWCISCHDSGTSVCDGVSAPNVEIFYESGHGRQSITVECLDCHDVTFTHIDGDARTYTFNPADYGLSGISYASGYRLRYVNGQVPLMIPSNYSITFGYDAGIMRDNAFRLCFDCHDSLKIFDNTPGDGIASNFKASLPDPPRNYSYAWGSGADINEHVAHILNYVMPSSDSDWDTGTTGPGGSNGCDSLTACSTCHNVHGALGTEGSTNESMIRDGTLAGRAGYGFSYVIEDSSGYPIVTSTGATQSNSIGAIFRNNTNNMCAGSMCHGNPTPPPGSSYNALGSSWGTYLEYFRP